MIIILTIVLVCYQVVLILIRFSDRLEIEVAESAVQSVALTGCGQGSSLITVPTLPPCIDVGPQYCGHAGCYQFLILNKGRQRSSVTVTTAGFKIPSKSVAKVLDLFKVFVIIMR